MSTLTIETDAPTATLSIIFRIVYDKLAQEHVKGEGTITRFTRKEPYKYSFEYKKMKEE